MPALTLRRRRTAALGAVVAGLALALGAGTACAPPAGAHATLVSVDPADGARLDDAPAEVRLTFSERVSAALGGVRVVGADGERVDEGAVAVEGQTVAVPLAGDLGDGTYVITYRVISADGHPVRGASVFGVGPAAIDPTVAARVGDGRGDRTWEVVGALGRGLAYGGTLLAAGGAIFLVVAHRGGAERPALRRTVRTAALLGALAGVVALPVQAALGTGLGPGSLFDEGVLTEVLDDGVGLGLGLAIGGLVLAEALLERQRALAGAAAVVAAASFAATGHNRAGDTSTLATAADAVHLVVVATWLGGAALLLLALALRRRHASAPEQGADPAPGGAHGPDEGAGTMVLRFSALATAGLLAATATGSVLAWAEVRTVDALTGTGYGRLLLAKLAAVAVLIGLGAYNRFRLVPALRGGKVRSALAHLRRTLAAEAAAFTVVLGLTAVLVVVTPGRTAAGGGPAERRIELPGAGSAQLVVDPAQPGFNRIHVYTYDEAGRPTELADEVVLELELPAAGIGPLQRTATRAGPAHAQLNGRDLAVAGTWQITVRIRLDRFTEVSGTAALPISA